jgi:hypothetical protein
VDRRLLNAVHRLNSPSGQSMVDRLCVRSQFRSAHALTIDWLRRNPGGMHHVSPVDTQNEHCACSFGRWFSLVPNCARPPTSADSFGECRSGGGDDGCQ